MRYAYQKIMFVSPLLEICSLNVYELTTFLNTYCKISFCCLDFLRIEFISNQIILGPSSITFMPAPKIDQYQMQALQFSVHLIDLLSILLRCNGFTGIQKARVDQTGSSPPSVTMTFSFGASLALGSDL